jgi:hypothetical protein
LDIIQRDFKLTGLLADGSPLEIDLNSMELGVADHVSPDALLTVTLVLPGDFNNDGVVDTADYTVWRNNVGANVALPNDTSPGMVTEHDYAAWRANFGSTRPGGSLAGSSNVPEPAYWLMLVGSALCVAVTNGRRARSVSAWRARTSAR